MEFREFYVVRLKLKFESREEFQQRQEHSKMQYKSVAQVHRHKSPPRDFIAQFMNRLNLEE